MSCEKYDSTLNLVNDASDHVLHLKHEGSSVSCSVADQAIVKERCGGGGR